MQLTGNSAVGEQLTNLCEVYDIVFSDGLTDREKNAKLEERFALSLDRAQLDNFVSGGGSIEIPDDPRGRRLTLARASLYVCREHSRDFDQRFAQPID